MFERLFTKITHHLLLFLINSELNPNETKRLLFCCFDVNRLWIHLSVFFPGWNICCKHLIQIRKYAHALITVLLFVDWIIFFFFSPLEEKKVIIPIESSRLDVVFPCRKTLQDVSHCHHLRMALQNLGVFLVHVILINSLPRVNLTSNNWNYWRKKMMRLALTRFYRSPSRKDSLTCVRRWSCVCPVICVFLMLTYRYFFRARIYTYVNHLDLRLPLLVFLGGCGLLLVHSVGSQTSLYSSFTCHDHQM